MEASWKILGVQSIDQFTMRGLAKELNIQAPTIYWYFDNKQLLFQALANNVARDIIPQLPSEGTWSEQLLQSAWTIRRKLKQFACSAQLLMKTIPESDFKQLINCLLRMIEPTPLSAKQKISYTYHVFNFVVNFAVDEYERSALASLMDSQENKLSKDLSDSPLFQQYEDQNFYIDSEQLFESGIQLLLIGIECKVNETIQDKE
ncbi:TetR/AcrR family transcriptional regulator [Paenibacillus eucommiae]|uniref:TetR/AcrR family tetracycline transcriptional repressor n=1 Tax=Paenibacillus eucommiae TaxID=1355755 RepID=A0ABS4JA01_9BACL|nr:TetR/AcrR family transcriptional regulator [Paenibacillus eucommiae]MBP1996070.1 TetR/AcrR family tetracycline transcriptional repressor [Paenibacillus eucommiae]